MGDEGAKWGKMRAENNHQKAADQSEVFQKVPEVVAALALPARPEVSVSPEFMVEKRGKDTEPRQHEGGHAIVPGKDDAYRHHQFDDDRNHQEGSSSREET
jgi:hypothetical protein